MTTMERRAYEKLRRAHAYLLNRRWPNLAHFVQSGAGLHAAFLLSRAMSCLLGTETAVDVINWQQDLARIFPETTRRAGRIRA